MKPILKYAIYLSIVIAVMFISFILFYPRSSKSFDEVDTVMITYYDGEYKKIIVNDSEKKQIFSMINTSLIVSLDLFFVGDDCGGDGPSIKILYKDQTIDDWDLRRDAQYCRYMYKDGAVDKMIIIRNNKLKSLIQAIIDKN